MKQKIQKVLGGLGTGAMTLAICVALPPSSSFANDRSIYNTAVYGNITVMLGLDQSSSMNAYFDKSACDAPQGSYGIRYVTTNKDSDGINRYAAKHPGITFSYDRHYCTVTPPLIKARKYRNTSNQYRWQMCTNSTTATPIRYQEDCIWGAELSSDPGTTTRGRYYFRQPGTTGVRRIDIFYDRDTGAAGTKYYDRLARVKDGVYQVLYGPNPIDDNVSLGLGIYPLGQGTVNKHHLCGTDVTTTERIRLYEKGVLCLPAQTLDSTSAIGTATNHRADLMRAVASMQPYRTGEHRPFYLTPSLAMYADLAAYLMGTNTLRRPLAKIKYVNQIEYKYCDDGDDDRDAAGACKDWRPSGTRPQDWNNTSLPNNVDINNLEEAPLSKCLAGYNNDRLTGITHCYIEKRLIARHVRAEKDGVVVWRSCNEWDGIAGSGLAGACRTTSGSYWRNSSNGENSWSSTAPNDPKMIDFDSLTEEQTEALTEAQLENAYEVISAEDYKCPDGDNRLTLDAHHDFTCYGGYEDVPVLAVIKTDRWRTCTGDIDKDGICKEFNHKPKEDGKKDEHWTTTAPTDIYDRIDDQPKYVSGFCSSDTYIAASIVPKNGAGRTGICYYDEDSAVYAQHIEPENSGFKESVSATKNPMPAGGVLAQTYKRPQAIKDQLANNQCGGQGVYLLTDGKPNAVNVLETGKLYRAALLNTDTSDTGTVNTTLLARNFNCRNGEFGGTNTRYACAANFAQALLNYASSPNAINRPIKTALVGFGNEYIDLPKYDTSLDKGANVAKITNYKGVSSRQKYMALLGIHGEGGWYRGNSAEDVAESIRGIIGNLAGDIPALNTGTVTIPLDEINPLKVQDSAFYPEFTPTPDQAYPLWFGNVKKYRILDGVLVDKNGTTIMDNTGRVRKTGITDFWKGTGSIGGALGKIPLRVGTANADGGTDIKDRNLLINQKEVKDGSTIIDYAATESGQLMNINSEHIKSVDANRGYLMALLGYSVGEIQAENPHELNAEILKARPLLRQMGGAMHSTPILLTQQGRMVYDAEGKATSTDRVEYVAFGTTQGLLQVVDVATGEEQFAFLPYEMMNKQKKAFLKKDMVTNLSGEYHGIDAEWTVYSEYIPLGDSSKSGMLTIGQNKANTARGKQNIYGGLRMGGRSYYALDVSKIKEPTLKFHINPDAAVLTGEDGKPTTTPDPANPLSYMGQSWSKPVLGFVNWKGKRKQVMFVGGGYDEGYEADNYNQTNKKGAGVYMFDADNGDLLWWSSANATTKHTGTTNNALKHDDMKYSVVSRINVLDRNSDGLVDHLYFADLGGQVWRVDINNAATAEKDEDIQFATRAVRLLDLTSTDGTAPRFYEAPNVSIHQETGVGRFAVVAVGSGDRSSPLNYYTAAQRTPNALYAIFDKDVGSNKLYEDDYSVTTQNLTLASLVKNTNRVSNDVAKDAIGYSNYGWYYPIASLDPRFSSRIQSAKVMGELVSMDMNLYMPIYDRSLSGAEGACGSGVIGATVVQRLCLPYGKCDALGDNQSNDLYLGAGILGINIGGGTQDASLKVIGGVCTGEFCTNVDGLGTEKNSLVKKDHIVRRGLFPTNWYELTQHDQ